MHPYAPRQPPGGRRAAACRAAGFTLVELVIVLAILVVVASLAIWRITGVQEQAENTVAAATLRSVRDAWLGTDRIPGYLSDMKHVPGFRIVAIRTHDLLSPSSYPAFAVFDPLTARGWRGPYVRDARGVSNTNPARNGAFPAADERRWEDDQTFLERGFYADAASSEYGLAGDRVVADPWGNPVVLQLPAADAFALSAGEAKRFRFARLVSAGPDGMLQSPRDRLAGMQPDGTSPLRGDDLILFLNRADIYETEEP